MDPSNVTISDVSSSLGLLFYLVSPASTSYRCIITITLVNIFANIVTTIFTTIIITVIIVITISPK